MNTSKAVKQSFRSKGALWLLDGLILLTVPVYVAFEKTPFLIMLPTITTQNGAAGGMLIVVQLVAAVCIWRLVEEASKRSQETAAYRSLGISALIACLCSPISILYQARGPEVTLLSWLPDVFWIMASGISVLLVLAFFVVTFKRVQALLRTTNASKLNVL